ncbi:hypothetical protein HRI_004644100 [Hibiscus trionum]|uniref:RRM domain-containing protein n=1 Tax=Hibiscus trionum TaxID=183268 RepID=A0A9W7JDK1_HIBTR|nr:hypothetical protein HRI_004644100 [Hibiscus trionum]
MAVTADRSFSQDMEFRCLSLNPEAPAFFPARYTLVSAPCFPIFTPLNPLDFLHCPPLNPLDFLHCPPLPSLQYPHAFAAPPFSHYQLENEPHFSVREKAVTPVEPLKAKNGLYRSKHHLKEGFFRADHSTGVARKKEWRVKHSNGEKKKHFGENVDGYPRKKVHDWAAIANNKREKRPLIPLKSDGKETTIMLKNIPIRYTREMLKDFLDKHCMLSNLEAKSQNGGAGDDEPSFSAFDFLYLPMDFVTKSNKGYAFVNFTNPVAARKLYNECHDTHWDCFKSNKILQIYCAKLQGVNQLVKHFERMGFPCEDFQPLCFHPARDGSKQSVEETVVGKVIGCRRSNSKSM